MRLHTAQDESDGLSVPARTWFSTRYGSPSPVQSRVWPLMAAGNHLLFSAPTGTGKTLAAFMVALDRLTGGDWEGGGLRVLYLSPLKALGNDINRNLMEPLEGLNEARLKAGLAVSPVRVMVRSGDTTASERARFQRRQPEILITTPESLGILLCQKSAAPVFAGLKVVIMDEIHAVLESKRGSLLSLMLEKLERLAPGFQRVGISATVNPIEEAARFLGGWKQAFALEPGKGSAATFVPRPVLTVQEKGSKSYGIQVALSRSRPLPEEEERHYWESLGLELRKLVKERTRTLIFCNSRRSCETLARFINGTGDRPRQPSGGPGSRMAPDPTHPASLGRPADAASLPENSPEILVYPHHGSLSRELRLGVETGLKEGTLRGIVATSSLELGIDIGDLDQVVLVQAPPSVSSALQRAGRSGHRPGETSRLLVYPGYGIDSLRCAALARAILDQDIDSLRIPLNPLDVLAQGLLALCLDTSWEAESLYDAVRHSHSFHSLSRPDFDRVLDMLLGKYGDIRLAELLPRLMILQEEGQPDRFAAVDQARSLLFSRGGSIPGRGSFVMRDPEGRRIGELDEEFVWERRKGDRFLLGNRVWEIRQMDDQSVHVQPSAGFAMLPFWRGEELDLSFALSSRNLALLDQAEFRFSRGSRESLVTWLGDSFCLEPPAAESLASTLERQRAATGFLPGSRRVVLEEVRIPEREGEVLHFLHTFWGNKVNRPFALLLYRVWKDKTGQDLEYYLGNEGLLFVLPEGQAFGELLLGVPSLELIKTLKEELTSSVWFAARFRENAGRAMLLGGGFGKRTPLWLLRRKAGKLLSALWKYPDFPLLKETWRQCLEDELEPEALHTVLSGLESGSITLTTVTSSEASPFAQGLMYRHTGNLMYQADQASPGLGRRALEAENASRQGEREEEWALAFESASVLRGFSRPELETFDLRLQPETLAEGGEEALILDWLERLRFVDLPIWTRLWGEDHPHAQRPAKGATGRKPPFMIHGQAVYSSLAWKVRSAFLRGLRAGADLTGQQADSGLPDHQDLPELPDLVADHLGLTGPESLTQLSQTLDLDQQILHEALEALVEEGSVVKGLFSLDSRTSGDIEYTAPDILESLHRRARKSRRTTVPLLDLPSLPGFLASWQGLGGRHDQSDEVLRSGIRRISFLPEFASLWESTLFPLRFTDWQASSLDSLCLGQGLAWRGMDIGARKIWWVLPEDEGLAPGVPANPKELRQRSEFLETDLGRFLSGPWQDQRPRTFADLHLEIRRQVNPSASATDLESSLWKAVFLGLVSHTDPAMLRHALAANFATLHPDKPVPGPPRRPPSYREWELHRLGRGLWYPVPSGDERSDLDHQEVLKDRCRLLLDRYGLVHPALLSKEMPGFTWRDLSLTFRLLELSGEVEAGYFVQGLTGLQYAHPEALLLLEGRPFPAEFWVQAAQDPSSLCGTGLIDGLPPRKAGTFLVWNRHTPLFAWHASGAVEDLAFTARPPESAGQSALPVLDQGLWFLLATLDRLALSALVGGVSATKNYQRLQVSKANGSSILVDDSWRERLLRAGFRRHGEVLLRFRPV